MLNRQLVIASSYSKTNQLLLRSVTAFKIKIPQPYCELIYQFQVLRCWQGFGKNICQVVRRVDLSTRNAAIPFEFDDIVMFQGEVS
eukprot:g14297.t1